MADGYIKAYRSLLDSWLWGDRPYSYGQAFEYILFSACYKPCKLLIDKKVTEVDRGEFYTSIRKLSEQFGWSREKTRRFLELLVNDEKITYQTSHRNTLVKVLNYNKYQDEAFEKKPLIEPLKSHSKATEKPLTNHSTATDKPLTDTKEESKESKESKIYNSPNGELLKILELFNEICISLPRVQKLTNSRERTLRNSQIRDWEQFFLRVEASDFLSGRVKNWKASFDWIIKPSNAVKILEGNYDNQHAVSGTEKMAAALGEFINGD